MSDYREAMKHVSMMIAAGLFELQRWKILELLESLHLCAVGTDCGKERTKKKRKMSVVLIII